MNGKHAIYRVYQALCAGMLSLFPAGRQTLVQGDGCITRIPELLKTHGIKGVQVITTPGTIRRGTVAPLLAQCEDAGIRTVLYTGVSPDPTVTEVDAAAECFFVSGCEAILAIGGGSGIDCAKVAGARTSASLVSLPIRITLFIYDSSLPSNKRYQIKESLISRLFSQLRNEVRCP